MLVSTLIRRHTIPLLALALMLGCSRESGPSHAEPMVDPGTPEWLPSGGPTPIAVAGELLADAPVFGKLGRMLVVGDRLWVVDRNQDPFLHVIDLHSGALLRSVGRLGEGPGDFRSTWSLSTRPGDPEALWAFDLNLQRVTRVPEEAEPGNPPIIRVANTFSRSLHVQWLDAHHLVGIGHADTNRFMVFDTLGQVAQHFAGPLFGDSTVPLARRIASSTAVKVCSHPDGGRFATAFGADAARIDLTTYPGGTTTRLPTPIQTDGEFVQDSAGRWTALHRRRFYIDCAATSTRLYALYSGRLGEAFPDGEDLLGHLVHIFDWSGTLLGVVALDRPHSDLAVAGDSALYLLTRQEPGIYRYRLPKISR